MNENGIKAKKSLAEILTQADSWLKSQTPKWSEDFGKHELTNAAHTHLK